MTILIALVGVRGAGKSSLIAALSSRPDVYLLKPSTTRAKRSPNDSEYHFLTSWNPPDFAWTIDVGGNKYGMSNAELKIGLQSPIAITVFDSGSIDAFHNFKRQFHGSAMSIGLDTVISLDEQKLRVNSAPARIMTQQAFTSEGAVVRACDTVISGNESSVQLAMHSILDVLMSRGGVLLRKEISTLINAGLLLQEVTDENISTASYDLRVGSDTWCQGKFVALSDSNPVLKIPAYSYAIVSAMEIAALPNFVSARFDLKNSLFFQGLILSNGPQVDPGYRGSLFCMIYNGSDNAVGLTYSHQFATLEFVTTSGIGSGYQDKYQGKRRLKDFIPSTAAVSEGGQILERTESKIRRLEFQWYLYVPIIGASFLALFAYAVSLSNEIRSQQQKVEEKINELNILQQKLDSFMDKKAQDEQIAEQVKALVENMQKNRSGTPASPQKK